MRVAFVPGSYRPDRCGVSHYTAHLVAELQLRGIECLVVTTREAARHHERPGVLGVTGGWGPGMLLPLALPIRRLNPDILHIQHAAGSFAFRRAVFWLVPVLRAIGWRGPVVVTLHEYGWWPWRPRLLGRAWDRLGPWGEARGLWDREDFALLTCAQLIIATHEATAEVLKARLPRLAPRIEQIVIGSNIPVLATDVAAARTWVREHHGWEPGAPVVVYFGFLHPVKGLETLLAAFGQVLAREPAARLLIVGGAESLALHGEEAERYTRRLKGMVQEMGLGPAVRLTGYLPDESVSRCLAGADLGVLPFNGGLTMKSGSLLAMWSHGLPVVGTRPAQPPPELEHTAWLVPARNADALAAALLKLLGDEATRGVLADRARRVATGFDWGAIADRHVEIYEAVSGWSPAACRSIT